MRNTQLQFRNAFAFLAAAAFLWVGPPTFAQSPQDNPPARQDDDRSRGEVASFDQFLDSHRQISEELRGYPARIRNSEFLKRYPELQAYLQSHPAVQQQLTANPDEFMRAVERRDYQEQFGPGSTRRDPDVTRRELASFDRFLDDHQQISQELRGDPSRIRNNQFLQRYPELQAYLQNHPAVREELNENPNSFMWAENNYDYREQQRDQANNRQTDADNRRDNENATRSDNDARRDRDFDARRDNDARRDDRDRDNRDRDIDAPRDRDVDARRDNDGRRDNDVRSDNRSSERDASRGELAGFDRFLDSHREIGEQVRKNPSLVRDGQFLKTHPQLQTYLQEHPAVRQELSANPNPFMTAENRFDQREDNRYGGQATRDRDTTHGQLASFDQFLDHHREIAEQLRKDPSLVNNQKWVQEHPALQTYLQDHKGVREEITENPNAFMTAENRYDRREDSYGRETNRGDMRHGDMDSFRDFLGNHSSIAQQLHKDPSLAKNPQFLETHPEFRAYLTAHPSVQSALVQDPHSFMKSAAETGTTTKSGTTTTTKPTTTDPTKPPKL